MNITTTKGKAMSATDGMAALAGLTYAMAPEGSKYRKQADAATARAARRAAVTPEAKQSAKAKRIAKTIAEKEAWIADCISRGDDAEADRWTTYVATLKSHMVAA